jgi:hypothetical protein
VVTIGDHIVVAHHRWGAFIHYDVSNRCGK